METPSTPSPTPAPTPAVPPRLWFGALWSRAWARYQQEFRLLFLISFIGGVVSLIQNLISESTYRRWADWAGGGDELLFTWVDGLSLLLMIIGLIASIWAGLALAFVAARPGEAATVKDAFNRSGPFFGRAFRTGLLNGLIILGGIILLVIPGLYWAILFSLSGMVVYKESLSGMAALRRSKELVKGRWWHTFATYIILGAFVGIPVAIVLGIVSGLANEQGVAGAGEQMYTPVTDTVSNIISMFLLPIILLFQSFFYDNMKETR